MDRMLEGFPKPRLPHEPQQAHAAFVAEMQDRIARAFRERGMGRLGQNVSLLDAIAKPRNEASAEPCGLCLQFRASRFTRKINEGSAAEFLEQRSETHGIPRAIRILPNPASRAASPVTSPTTKQGRVCQSAGMDAPG